MRKFIIKTDGNYLAVDYSNYLKCLGSDKRGSFFGLLSLSKCLKKLASII